MDRLATMAEQHYRTHLPQAYAAIPAAKRTAFFEGLAEQANLAIADLEDELAGPDQPGETFQERLGRLTEARSAAESQVIREMVMPDPETVAASGRNGLAEELNLDPEQQPMTAAERELDEATRAFWTAAEEMDNPPTAPTR